MACVVCGVCRVCGVCNARLHCACTMCVCIVHVCVLCVLCASNLFVVLETIRTSAMRVIHVIVKTEQTLTLLFLKKKKTEPFCKVSGEKSTTPPGK